MEPFIMVSTRKDRNMGQASSSGMMVVTTMDHSSSII